MAGGNTKRHRWKLFHRSSSKRDSKQPPMEFLCPISGSLMSDPVVVSSGQTFDRVSVQVCKDYNFTWALEEEGEQSKSKVDFSAVIPNLALKTAISNWCDKNRVQHAQAVDYSAVEKIVKEKMEAEGEKNQVLRSSEKELIRGVADKPTLLMSHAATELGPPRVNHFCSGSSSSSVESVVVAASPPTPLPQLTTRPECYSSCSSSSEIEQVGHSAEEDEVVRKMKSGKVYEQEDGVIQLRRVTKVNEKFRVLLCTNRIISALRELMASRYSVVQTNAVAALVNLSLENCNKLKIVRAGVVPVVIDLLKGGAIESQEHAAGALFSLSLEDENKMAIGVLGALPPLMYALRSESERARNDSALALYHLSLVHSNRVKLVKLGAVNTMLEMVKSGSGLGSRVLLVLCNLAVCVEGRSAILDANAVECFVGMLRRGEFDSEAMRENLVAALYALSHGSLRFKGLAKEARAVEVLKEIEEKGTDRARAKARRILQMMKGRDGGGEEDVDWEEILESGVRNGGGKNNGANSTNF